jgi:twitching motility protein PilU
MRLMEYFKLMMEKDASDLFLSTLAPPSVKIHGQMIPLGLSVFDVGEIQKIAYEIMSEEQIHQFEVNSEMNMAFSESGLGRFRVNIFRQRNEVAMVVRSLRTDIPIPDELGLPQVLKQMVMKKRGLIIVTGATGVGKSTTLASLIKHRSIYSSGHIITIEDPIELLHKHTDKTLINQREIGVDTKSYNSALENALRQAPDVILIGEARIHKAMEYALRFAETGHLCLTSLHAHRANQAIERIINFFPHDQHKQLLLDLSIHLIAIVSQRLIPTHTGKRIAAFEILSSSALVADLIKQGRIDDIPEVIEKSEVSGMQTFDTDLFRLYREGIISFDEAMNNADSPNNLRIRISLAKGNKCANGESFSIMPDGL